ncbi:MAG: DUF4332 domain-containing protein [Bdellovibrionota bacterium]|nr:DUF4332 domain-containing protein [Bdellovibrionota bacterium]
MSESIRKVEGIGEEYQSKLEYIGIHHVSEFIAMTQTQEQRDELARRAAIPVGHIDNWASMLDLTRVNGIGYQYAELLTYSGVKSVEDFRKRNPHNLHEILMETNNKHFCGTVPTENALGSLIESSKKLTNITQRY